MRERPPVILRRSRRIWVPILPYLCKMGSLSNDTMFSNVIVEILHSVQNDKAG